MMRLAAAWRYEAEKRLALDAWSRTIERIIDGKPANVVPLKKRG